MIQIPGVSEISYGPNFDDSSDFTFALIVRLASREARETVFKSHFLHKRVAKLLFSHFKTLEPEPIDPILSVNMETEFVYLKPFGD